MPNPTTQPSQADREELKPCPFCGGEAKLKAWSWPYDRFRVQCAACRCQASGLRADPEDAIAAWNTRFERDTEKRVRESLPNGEWIRLHVWADAEAACDVVINQTTFSSEVMPGERVWYRRGAEAAKASIRMACSYDAQHSPRESLAGEANVERVKRAREALGRIASNGFGHPLRTLDPKRDAEMMAMMDYARAALATLESKGADLSTRPCSEIAGQPQFTSSCIGRSSDISDQLTALQQRCERLEQAARVALPFVVGEEEATALEAALNHAA